MREFMYRSTGCNRINFVLKSQHKLQFILNKYWTIWWNQQNHGKSNFEIFRDFLLFLLRAQSQQWCWIGCIRLEGWILKLPCRIRKRQQSLPAAVVQNRKTKLVLAIVATSDSLSVGDKILTRAHRQAAHLYIYRAHKSCSANIDCTQPTKRNNYLTW